MIVSENAYLEHYGVKGMKWGVRKDRSTRSEGRQKAKKQSRKEKIRAAGILTLAGGLTVAGAAIVGSLINKKNPSVNDIFKHPATITGKNFYLEIASKMSPESVSLLTSNFPKK